MKRIFFFLLILVALLFVWIFKKMLPDFYFNLGKSAYEQKNYSVAFVNLKKTVHLSPKNRDARYYFVDTMLNLKPTLQVQKELFKISEVNQPDSADLISDRQISKWKNQIFLNVGENYIEQVPFNGNILRWDTSKFPLKVYIQNNSAVAPAYYAEKIKQAFLQWQKSSRNLVRFEFVDNEKDADINVSIISSDEMKKCTQEDCKYTIAYNTPKINGSLLKKMTILFYDSNNLGQPFKEKDIYNTALHEIGHALGIMGHSYNKDDIMYMETTKPTGFEVFRSDFQSLTSKDLNTLWLLYKMVPDITNTQLNEYDTSNQFFAPIILGSGEQISSRKVLEAQNYINSAPDLPNGYIDLAAAFSELKKYNKAIQALNKAFTLCSNDNERFVVSYNLAVIYMEIKDWENSLRAAQSAKQLKPSSEVDGLIAMINYNLGNKELAKKIYTEALNQNPDNIIDAYNLATIYIKELNLVQAGKVLNRLIEANPDAKNEPRIKRYSLLILLFK
ncbi:MAG: matrixin family metalloprotease [Candidatus Gastranaerophilales bacterium]|nr:matrixin family metalloprotease [Candidatus Gastranaerophilales bacterium]